MNGPIDSKIVFDTNWVINHLKAKNDVKEFAGTNRFISVVTRIELYAFPHITPAGKKEIDDFLQAGVTVIPLNDEVEQKAIEVRRKFNPKLPDAVVAATALVLGASLVTGDGPLAKKKIPGLPIIFVPSPLDKVPSWWKVFKASFKRNRALWIAVGCLTVSSLVFAILFILI